MKRIQPRSSLLDAARWFDEHPDGFTGLYRAALPVAQWNPEAKARPNPTRFRYPGDAVQPTMFDYLGIALWQGGYRPRVYLPQHPPSGAVMASGPWENWQGEQVENVVAKAAELYGLDEDTAGVLGSPGTRPPEGCSTGWLLRGLHNGTSIHLLIDQPDYVR